MTRRLLRVALVSAGLSVVAWAADEQPAAVEAPPKPAPEAAPALAAEPVEHMPMPAPDPKVEEILKTLGEGCSAALPGPKTAGQVNAVARKYGLDKVGPGSRNYCIKMAWMPDRKRAIYWGANHGVPHRLNDVWEYDLPANTWNCLYAPDTSKGGKGDYSDVDRESADTKAGVIYTRRGGPAVIGHSWWNMTYDPGLKAMLTFCTWSMSDAELFKLLAAGKHKPPLWAAYPESGRWAPIMDGTFVGPAPRYENARALEYVPELGGSVWIKSDGMWLYNSVSNCWKDLKPNGGNLKEYQANMPDREQVVVYAPDRKLLIAHSRNNTSQRPTSGRVRTTHYSIETNAWKVAFEGPAADNNPPGGFDAQTGFVYDTVSRMCILVDTFETKTLWAYDPDTAKWTRLEPKGAPLPAVYGPLCYYDQTANAVVVAGQWVYRHKAAKRE
jgi:hypothetical protein